jgi:hypothetical protein
MSIRARVTRPRLHELRQSDVFLSFLTFLILFSFLFFSHLSCSFLIFHLLFFIFLVISP